MSYQKNSVRQSYNSKLFVERPELYRALWENFEQAASGISVGLQFHGGGGVGKTWLFNNFKEQLQNHLELKLTSKDPGMVFSHLSLNKADRDILSWFIDLRMNTLYHPPRAKDAAAPIPGNPDADIKEAAPKVSSLERFFRWLPFSRSNKQSVGKNAEMSPDTESALRKTLGLHFGKFRRFDALVTILDSRFGEGNAVHPKLKSLLKLGDGTEMAVENFVQVWNITVIAGAKLIRQVFGKHLSAKAVKEFEDDFAGLENWTKDDCLDRLGLFLAKDFSDLQRYGGESTLVVMIDGHDKLFSVKSNEESDQLNETIRAFCESLDGGLIVLFSQYRINWFVKRPDEYLALAEEVADDSLIDGLRVLEDSKLPNLSISTGEEEADSSEWQRPSAALVGDVPARECSIVHMKGFEEDSQKWAQLSGLLDQDLLKSPAAHAIVAHTSLPFEIAGKARHLAEFPETKNEKKAYSRSFWKVFQDVLGYRPDVESRLLQLISYLPFFDHALLGHVSTSFDLAIKEETIERVLGSAFLEPYIDEAENKVWRVEHHYQRIMKQYHQEKILDSLGKNAGTEKVHADLYRLSRAIMDYVAKQRETKPIRFCQELLETLLGFFNAAGEKRCLLAEEFWPKEAIFEFMDLRLDYLEDTAYSTPDRELASELNTLLDWSKKWLDNPAGLTLGLVSTSLMVFVRSTEIRVNILARPGLRQDLKAGRKTLEQLRDGLEVFQGSIPVTALPATELNYWVSCGQLIYHMQTPKLNPVSAHTKGSLAKLGSSRTYFARAMEGFLSVEKKQDHLITRSRFYCLSGIRFYEHAAKVLTAEDHVLRRQHTERRAELLSKATSRYVGDIALLKEHAKQILDFQDKESNTSDLKELLASLKRAAPSSRRDGELLYWIEKAHIQLARRLLRQEDDQLYLTDAARSLLRSNFEAIWQAVQGSENPPFLLLQLTVKTLRKTSHVFRNCGEELSLQSFDVSQEDVSQFFTKVFDHLTDLGAPLDHSVLYECSGLSGFNRSLQEVMLEVARSLTQTLDDNYQKAFWSSFVVEIQRDDYYAAKLDDVLTAIAAIQSLDGKENDNCIGLLKRLPRYYKYVASNLDADRLDKGYGERYFTLIQSKPVLVDADIDQILCLAENYLEKDISSALDMYRTYLPELMRKNPLDLTSFVKHAEKYLDFSDKEIGFSASDVAALRLDLSENRAAYSGLFVAGYLNSTHLTADKDLATQILAATLVAVEPRLDSSDKLRQQLRRQYASSFWKGLKRYRDEIRSFVTPEEEPSEQAIEGFATADGSAFADDLLDFIYRCPTPQETVAGDMIAVDIVGITKAVVDNGGSNGPGRALLCRHHEQEFWLTSNLASTKTFKWSQSLGQSLIEEDGGEDNGVEGPVSLSDAMDLGVWDIDEPKRVLVSLRGRHDGVRHLTQRGDEYALKALELLYPGLFADAESGVRAALGGSNSILCCLIPPYHKSRLLENGWFTNEIKEFIGVNRVPLVDISGDFGPIGVEKEIRNFINDTFQDLKLVELSGATARFLASKEFLAKKRTIDTFTSLFSKLFQGFTAIVSPREGWWQSDGHQEFEDQHEKNRRLTGSNALDLSREHTVRVTSISNRHGRPNIIQTQTDTLDQVIIEKSTIDESGCYFVPNQLLRVRVSTRGIRYVASSVSLYEYPVEDLHSATVVSVDKGSGEFLAEYSFENESGVTGTHTAAGKLGFAASASYYDLAVGELIQCLVEEDENGRSWLTYLHPKEDRYSKLKRQKLSVGNYSARHQGYFLRTEESSRAVLLSIQLVNGLGYSSLFEGDVIVADVLYSNRAPFVRRIHSCERPLWRSVSATLEGTRADGTPLLRIDGPPHLSEKLKGRALNLRQTLIDTNFLPNFSKVSVTVQQDQRGNYFVSRLERIHFAHDGKLQLGQLRKVTPKDKPAFMAFRRLGDKKDAYVTTSLLDSTQNYKDNTRYWMQARLVETSKGLSVGEFKGPFRSTADLEAGRLNYSVRNDNIHVRTPDGEAIAMHESVLSTAGLSDNWKWTGLPVEFQFIERKKFREATFFRLNGQEVNTSSCYLIPPNKEKKARFLLCSETNQSFIVPPGHPDFDFVDGQMPGFLFVVKWYEFEGKTFLISATQQTRSIPWRYGIVKKATEEACLFEDLDGDRQYRFQAWMVKDRIGGQLEVGSLARYTVLPNETPGMMEFQDPDQPWAFNAFIKWYDPNKDFACAILEYAPEKDIRFNSERIPGEHSLFKAYEEQSSFKWMPVVLTLNCQTGRAFPGSVVPRDIRGLPWIRGRFRYPQNVGPHGFVDFEHEDGKAADAYIREELMADVDGRPELQSGAEIFFRVIPNAHGNYTVVQWIPIDLNALAPDEHVMVAIEHSSSNKSGRFKKIQSGETYRSLSTAFDVDRPETGDLPRNTLVLTSCSEVNGVEMVTEIVEVLGVVSTSVVSLQDAGDPLET